MIAREDEPSGRFCISGFGQEGSSEECNTISPSYYPAIFVPGQVQNSGSSSIYDVDDAVHTLFRCDKWFQESKTSGSDYSLTYVG